MRLSEIRLTVDGREYYSQPVDLPDLHYILFHFPFLREALHQVAHVNRHLCNHCDFT